MAVQTIQVQKKLERACVIKRFLTLYQIDSKAGFFFDAIATKYSLEINSITLGLINTLKVDLNSPLLCDKTF